MPNNFIVSAFNCSLPV